jgi:4-phytase / acid phosphatase
MSYSWRSVFPVKRQWLDIECKGCSTSSGSIPTLPSTTTDKFSNCTTTEYPNGASGLLIIATGASVVPSHDLVQHPVQEAGQLERLLALVLRLPRTISFIHRHDLSSRVDCLPKTAEHSGCKEHDQPKTALETALERRMSAKRFLILFLLVTPALSQTSQLRMAVVLTRHGVRSPLSPSTSSPYASRPWPSLSSWHVACPGDLTPRGKDLVKQMGIFYHAYYANKGLLPPVNQCPSSKVYIWSDNEERTLHTAKALTEGMSNGVSGCLMPVNSLPYTPPAHSGPNACTAKNPTDYFFHPLSDPLLKQNIDSAQIAAVAKQINQQVPQLLKTYQPSLQAMQSTLGCCDVKECNGSKPCTLFKLNSQATASGTSLAWKGMFSESSTAAENFLLEYGNGMPCNLNGWGLVTYNSPDCNGGQSFLQMEQLHTLYFDQTKHNGYMAQIQGSNLANQILLRLQQAGPAPFVIYSGHDTDVSSVAGLLGLTWSLPDLPDNDTPPAGALIFELWGGAAPKTQSVRMYYVHQTLTQLRTLAPLSLNNPPNMVELKLQGCAQPCPLTQFQTIVNGAILQKFTTKAPSGVMLKKKSAKAK